MKTNTSDGKNYFFDTASFIRLLFLLILVVAPITFAQSGWIGLFYGVAIGFLNGLFKRDNLLQAVFAGLIAGIIPTLSFSLSEGILVGLLTSFAIGFTTALAQVTEIDRQRIIYAALTGFLLGFTMGLGLLFYRNFSEVFPIILSMTLVSAPAIIFGIYTGRWIRPKILIYSGVWLYLREMAAYLVFFAIGYFTLALLFAGWYWSLWKAFPSDTFNNLSENPNFGEFFYFSFVTLATLGYGDITPQSDLARVLAIMEVTLGVGWITVVFAAVIAHLQPKFSEITGRENKEAEKP